MAMIADHVIRGWDNTILLQKASKIFVLLGQFLLVLRSIGIDLFQPQDFVFEGLDVELLALPVGSAASCQFRERTKRKPKGRTIWGTGSSTPKKVRATDLCACLFSSCRRVRAGLLSGFGPLRFGGWPSLVVRFSVSVLRKPRFNDCNGPLSGPWPTASRLPPPWAGGDAEEDMGFAFSYREPNDGLRLFGE